MAAVNTHACQHHPCDKTGQRSERRHDVAEPEDQRSCRCQHAPRQGIAIDNRGRPQQVLWLQ